MSKNREEWIINAPRKKVWEVFSRVDDWPLWMPGVRELDYFQGESLVIVKANAHYQASTSGFPLRQQLIVDQIVPEEKIVITRKLPGMETTSTYELSDDPSGGTKIVRTVKTEGFLSPIAGIVNQPHKSDIDSKLERLLKRSDKSISA